MALYYVDMGRRQILKCWAFISPQLEFLWRLLVTRHWLVSYYCCSPFRSLPDLYCFSLAFLLTNSVEKIHNLLLEGSKITGLAYRSNKLSGVVQGASDLWCDASHFSCYWFHLVVSQEGQTVLDNVTRQWETFQEDGEMLCLARGQAYGIELNLHNSVDRSLQFYSLLPCSGTKHRGELSWRCDCCVSVLIPLSP